MDGAANAARQSLWVLGKNGGETDGQSGQYHFHRPGQLGHSVVVAADFGSSRKRATASNAQRECIRLLVAVDVGDQQARIRNLPVRSNPTHEKEHEEDDQNDAEDTDAAVTVAVALAAESATEAAKQEDDENDDKNQPQG